jgi:hypothetical protein
LQLVARRALLYVLRLQQGCKHLRMRTALQAIAHLYGQFGPSASDCGDCSVLLGKVHPLYLPLSQVRFPIVFRDSMDFSSTNQADAKFNSKKGNSENGLKGKAVICTCGKSSGCLCGPPPTQTNPDWAPKP